MREPGRFFSLLSLVSVYLAGCGSDSSGRASGGSGSGASAGSAGSSGAGGTSASSGAGGVATSGTGGSDVTEDAGAIDAAPPGATDSGASVYTLECRGESVACGDPEHVRCLGVGSPDAAIGFACSNRCESVADCSSVATGGPAAVDCVQLTSARHCLLVCHDEDRDFACPSGMSCYVYPGSPVGYCLWQ